MRVRAWMSAIAVAAVVAAAVAAPSASAAAAAPGLPPKGKILLGFGGTHSTPAAFDRLTGARHEIWLVSAGTSYDWSSQRAHDYLQRAVDGDFRYMFHITPPPSQSPRMIARGGIDRFLLDMSGALNDSDQYLYVRPMAEMNGHWNTWSAFNADGSRRGDAVSTRWYRRSFQRISLIMHGGSVASIDATLRRNGMPPLATGDETLPSSGRVAMVWNPQGEGSPNVRGNQPRDYYPGRAYVDYVANDLYSIRGNPYWKAQNSLYAQFPHHPFMVAEWAPWGTDEPGYASAMFSWAASHPRTTALLYFHGTTSNLFRLDQKPRTLARYRSLVHGARYRCPACGAMTDGR